MTQITVMTGPERRRRWDFELRNGILAAAFSPGAVVADVARQYDVASSLIYKWRREGLASIREGLVKFVPAVLADDPAKPPAVAEEAVTLPSPDLALPVSITVEFPAGVRVSIDATAPVALVTAALLALQ